MKLEKESEALEEERNEKKRNQNDLATVKVKLEGPLEQTTDVYNRYRRDRVLFLFLESLLSLLEIYVVCPTAWKASSKYRLVFFYQQKSICQEASQTI